MQILNHLQKNRSIPLRQIQSISDILGIDFETEYQTNKNFLHACIQANKQSYYIEDNNKNLIYIDHNNKHIKTKFPYDLAIKKYFYSDQYDKNKNNVFKQVLRSFKIEKQRMFQQYTYQTQYEEQLIFILLNNKIRNKDIIYMVPTEQKLAEVYKNTAKWYEQQIGDFLSLEFQDKIQQQTNQFSKQLKILKLNDNKIACSILINFFKGISLPPQWTKSQSTQKYKYQTQGTIYLYNLHPALFYLIKQFYQIRRKQQHDKLNFSQKGKYLQYFKINCKQQGSMNIEYSQSIQKIKFCQKFIVKNQIDDNLLILIIHQLGLRLTPSIIGNYFHYIYEFFSNQNYQNWCVIPYNDNVYWQNIKTEVLVNVYPYLFDLYLHLSQKVIFIQTIPQIRDQIQNQKYESVNKFMSKIQNLRRKIIGNIFLEQKQDLINKKQLKDIFGSLYNRLTQQQMLRLVFSDSQVRILDDQQRQKLLLTVIASKNIKNKQQFIKLVKYLNKNFSQKNGFRSGQHEHKRQGGNLQEFINIFRNISKINEIKERQAYFTDQSSIEQNDIQLNKFFQQATQYEKLKKERELLLNFSKDSDVEPWQEDIDIQINQYHIIKNDSIIDKNDNIIDKNDQKSQIETPNFIQKNYDWNKSIFLSPSTEIKKQFEDKINNTDTTGINTSLGYSVQTFKNNQVIIDQDDNQDEQDKQLQIDRNKKFLKIFKRSYVGLPKSYKNKLHQQTLQKIIIQLCQNLTNVNNIQELQLYIITDIEIQDSIEQFNKSSRFINETKREKIYCDLMQNLYRKVKKRFKVEWKNDKLESRIRKSSLPQTNIRRKSISYTNLKRIKDLNLQKRIDLLLKNKLQNNNHKRSSMFQIQSFSRLTKL